jgi:hypothetical protein
MEATQEEEEEHVQLATSFDVRKFFYRFELEMSIVVAKSRWNDDDYDYFLSKRDGESSWQMFLCKSQRRQAKPTMRTNH